MWVRVNVGGGDNMGVDATIDGRGDGGNKRDVLVVGEWEEDKKGEEEAGRKFAYVH